MRYLILIFIISGFLFSDGNITDMNASVAIEKDSSIGTYVVYGVLGLIFLSYIMGIYKIIKNRKLVNVLTPLFLLLIWRAYSNYSLGGMIIPLNANEFREWVSTGNSIIEFIGWIIVFCMPFYYASRDECPSCESINIEEIDEKELSRDTISKMVNKAVGTKSDGTTIYKKEKEYYDVRNYEITMECKDCGHKWKTSRKTESVI